MLTSSHSQDVFKQFMLLQTQMSIQDIEREEEFRYLYVLELNDKDIPQTDQGKKDCRSVTTQMRLFKAQLPEDEIDPHYMFYTLDDTVDSFETYLRQKYKDDRGLEWEQKLSCPDYRQDVKNLFASRVYQHKHELAQRGIPAFASGQVHGAVNFLYLRKDLRKIGHETLGRYSKIAKKNPELIEHPDMVGEIFLQILDDLLDRAGVTTDLTSIPNIKAASRMLT